MYKNYRCRKCGNIISIEYNLNYSNPYMSSDVGIMIDKKHAHPKCNIEDTEKVYADLISRSERPLMNAAFIYIYDEYLKKHIFLNENEEIE